MFVSSVLEFPELYPIENTQKADLFITFGQIPIVTISDKGFHNDYYDITEKEFRITVEGVATFYAANGDKIIISAEPHADLDTIRIFCLSNPFAAILHQKKRIPLHCAAICKDDRLLLIFGRSGAGKSTVLGTLMLKGYTVFSDDVCVPELTDDNELFLLSSYPMLKFWKNTMYELGIMEISSRQIRKGIEKFGVYFHENFVRQRMSPAITIILEEYDNIISPIMTKITGVNAFLKLQEHAYRNEYLVHSGLKAEHFRVISVIADQSAAYLVKRPKDRNSVQEVVFLIEQLLQSKI